MSKIVNRILENRVLTHVLYWLAIVLGYAVPGMILLQSVEPLVNKLCYLPAQLIATYWLIYYQVPNYILTRKYFRFFLSFILSAYIVTVIARIFKVYVYETILGADLAKDSLINILTEVQPLLGQYFTWVYLVALITLLVKLIKDHFKEKEQIETLLKEKAQAEISFLKAQIHPHFLFNTLNNLYTLTLRKSDLAPNIVRKLSDMLSYMFYQCKAHSVPIVQEIQLLQTYIDLEMIRYGERLELKFEHELENELAEIAPLVLLSMVENAFKHGASGDINKPVIHIQLKEADNQLFFRVFNSKPPKGQEDDTQFKKGIGVSNIKRQLELIYPNHYSLAINEQERTYEVQLNIQLLQHKNLQTTFG